MARLSFLFVLALVIAACSSGKETGAIRPFSENAVLDPVVEVDPTGTTATCV